MTTPPHNAAVDVPRYETSLSEPGDAAAQPVRHPRIGSLCSGAGGLDLAVEHVYDATTAWHCEHDPAASRVLARRWPGVPNFGDITAVDWAAVEPVDIVVAGFPCQDVSAAGRRAGLKHGTRTGLFANVMQAVEIIRPSLVVLENVMGLFSADGDEWPDVLHHMNARIERRAAYISAIEYTLEKRRRDNAIRHRKEAARVRALRTQRTAVAEFRRERHRLVPRAIATVLGSLAQAGYDAQWTSLRASEVGAPHQRERVFILASPTDPGHHGRSRGTQCHLEPATKLETPHGNNAHRRHVGAPGAAVMPTPTSRDHKGAVNPLGRPPRPDGRIRGQGDVALSDVIADLPEGRWGKYTGAILQWAELTAPAPSPVEAALNRNSKPRLNARFSEWMMGWRSGWVCDLLDAGVITRSDAFRIIGNGVVTLQAAAALIQLTEIAEVAA